MDESRILLYPDSLLRRIPQNVQRFDRSLADAVALMQRVMNGISHCIGLAATQIGLDLRVFVMDTSRRERKSIGPVVLVNPILRKGEGSTMIKEGCLSVPSYLGRVRRDERVLVTGQAVDGRETEWNLSGLDAICAQHEIDHLNGMLFLDRLQSLRSDLFLRGR